MFPRQTNKTDTMIDSPLLIVCFYVTKKHEKNVLLGLGRNDTMSALYKRMCEYGGHIEVKRKEEHFVLVRLDQLPEAMQKTVEAKRLVEMGEADTIQQAVAKVGLSRSSFYKYRDSVFPFHSLNRKKMVTLAFMLKDQAGVLSGVLGFLAGMGVNILTIHQTIPLQGEASVSMSVDLTGLISDLEDLLERLRNLKGVHRAIVIGAE